ncbi:MAG TPA: plasmid pRiA4b ORF-3 family protein [Bacteroidales bacterium]|nr:plasmid pRiA4b ORF-3 family protein [Bacteroidales bacterium]
MKDELYQVKISLLGSKPIIWRRLVIPSNLLLPDFHKIIQTAMEWTNSHLHHFVKDRKFYEPSGDDSFMDTGLNAVGYDKVRVNDLLKKEKDKIIYEYDFGDSWEHEITLEKVLAPDKKNYYPVCIDGKRSAPPEDIGGIPGYYQFLEARGNPENELHEMFDPEFMNEFDPDYFDKDEINDFLKMPDFGCISFYDESLFFN